MRDVILDILKNDKTRKNTFSFMVLMIMFIVNVPIILKEAFGRNPLFDIAPILSAFGIDASNTIPIPLYQYSLISMFLQYILVIHASEIIAAAIRTGEKLIYKMFSIDKDME
jgi:hypothetical protein